MSSSSRHVDSVVGCSGQGGEVQWVWLAKLVTKWPLAWPCCHSAVGKRYGEGWAKP
jgi:hypothetical protein